MPDDELTRLRHADPVDQAALPSAHSTEAQALFERIAVLETDIAPTRTERRPRTMWLAAAAAALVAIAGGAALVAGDDNDRDTAARAGASTETTTTVVDSGGGPISPGGGLGMCVEVYDTTTLAHRELAFDGTVVSVDGDAVTFAVDEWFRGGDDAEVTLQGAEGLGGLTSAGPAASLDPGSRLLVAGDGGFAWSCGFTQPYDATVADQWRAALR